MPLCTVRRAQRFAWLCMAAQRGYEGSYADRSDSSYPAGDPAGIELAASTAAVRRRPAPMPQLTC